MTTPATTSKVVVETFRQLAKLPSPAGVFGRQTSSGFQLETLWSQRDLEKKETTKFLKNFIVLPNDRVAVVPAPTGSTTRIHHHHNAPPTLIIRQAGRPVDVTSELWRVYSASGEKIAVLRKGPAGEKEKEEKQLIEVWGGSSRLATIDVAAQEKHGKVYAADGVFGSFQVRPTTTQRVERPTSIPVWISSSASASALR